MVDLRATNGKLIDRALRIMMHICPRLTREQAAMTLKQADGDLKAAVVMLHTGKNFDEATQALHECGGRLRDAIEGRA
jgi:N-acetylmuramic acid 6-phosphate etherase